MSLNENTIFDFQPNRFYYIGDESNIEQIEGENIRSKSKLYSYLVTKGILSESKVSELLYDKSDVELKLDDKFVEVRRSSKNADSMYNPYSTINNIDLDNYRFKSDL
jgi:hypothetical protein